MHYSYDHSLSSTNVQYTFANITYIYIYDIQNNPDNRNIAASSSLIIEKVTFIHYEFM